ncbi:transketolase [candidate division GN15 bacterium]|nr:transketolase [candidate division GN15 bacterium]
MFDSWRGFAEEKLSADWHDRITEMARVARGHILTMTTVAGSGHPGGSMSSLETLLTLYNFARVDPHDPKRDDRDRIIISHGHVSPGAYSALAAVGFFDITPALHGFRQGGSPFEGHVEQSVPGIEWDTGNLGQGLSVGVGKAIYSRLSGQNFHSYVLMGDGEQQKGQLCEARRVAVKFGLTNITAWVDCNRLQISGKTDDILRVDIKAAWEADGWRVVDVDGHDLDALYDVFREATLDDSAPVMILGHTVMGKGVSFMEGKEAYHGAALKPELLPKAFEELGGCDNDLEALRQKRLEGPPTLFSRPERTFPEVDPGTPTTLDIDEQTDNRSAWGKALLSVAEANMDREDLAIAVFDCDLAGSVKTAAFGEKYPDNFFQCGITEHSTATMAGSLSTENAISIWADFAAFGVDETYNQARLNDINHGNLKLFCTHTGVNVGEDGKTHQCIDFFGLLNSTFGWKVITPADPNQTDRIARYVLSHPGNFAVFMGRAKLGIIPDENGKPYFGDDYVYRYGRMDTVRDGENLVLVAAGNMMSEAYAAWQLLNSQGLRIALVAVSDWTDMHPEDIAAIGGYRHVVTLEDHNVKNGMGVALSMALLDNGYTPDITRIGVEVYASSGKPHELYKLLKMDGASVAERIQRILEHETVRG